MLGVLHRRTSCRSQSLSNVAPRNLSQCVPVTAATTETRDVCEEGLMEMAFTQYTHSDGNYVNVRACPRGPGSAMQRSHQSHLDGGTGMVVFKV